MMYSRLSVSSPTTGSLSFYDSFIPELGEHLQHVNTYLLWVVIQTSTDDAEAIRCQDTAMQLVGLVYICHLTTTTQ